MSLKIERLQEQIRAKVATILRRDLNDPRLGMVTLTRIRLAQDLSHCRILWSTLDEGAAKVKTEKTLESARGFIQREVAKALATRTAPHVEFVFDESIAGAARIQDIIRQARADDEARKSPADRPEPGSEPPEA
jgi:ribosome-binding factor A